MKKSKMLYHGSSFTFSLSALMGRMMNRAGTYAPITGGVMVENTVYGFHIVVHDPADTSELEKRVAQAHADAIIAKVKKLNCSVQQKKALIDAVCT